MTLAIEAPPTVKFLAEGPEDGLRFLGEKTPEEIAEFFTLIGIENDWCGESGVGSSRARTCPVATYLAQTYGVFPVVGPHSVTIFTEDESYNSPCYKLTVPVNVSTYIQRADSGRF